MASDPAAHQSDHGASDGRRSWETAAVEPARPPLEARLVLGRALRRRCPVCGSGGIFRRWWAMRERCPQCGFRFERIAGHWVGSLGINTIVSFGILLGVLSVGFAITYPEPPVAPLVVIGVVIAVAVPLGFFPWSKTLWGAIDLLMRPLGPDDEVDPRWWPAARRRARPRRGRLG